MGLVLLIFCKLSVLILEATQIIKYHKGKIALPNSEAPKLKEKQELKQ